MVALATQHRKWAWRIGEVQLIGNIWVIVGSTLTSSCVGWDLTVPSEVTALTSASVHACSCQRHSLVVKKRTEPDALGTGTAAFDGSSVDSQRFSRSKIQPACWCIWFQKKWPCNTFLEHLFSSWLVAHSTSWAFKRKSLRYIKWDHCVSTSLCHKAQT